MEPIKENFSYFDNKLTQVVQDFVHAYIAKRRPEPVIEVAPAEPRKGFAKVKKAKKTDDTTPVTPVTPPPTPSEVMDAKIERLNFEFDLKLKKFVDYIYLPFIKTPDDAKDWGSQIHDNRLREEFIRDSESKASWLVWRDTAYKKLHTLVQEETAGMLLPTPALLSVKAMFEWEDVFANNNDDITEKLNKALRSLIYAYESGSVGISHLSENDVITSLADALVMAQQAGLIPSSPELKEAQLQLYKDVVESLGENFGKTNEYRYIYLLRKNDFPMIHATPFIDRVNANRVDMIFIKYNQQNKFKFVGYQTKSSDILAENEYQIKGEEINKTYQLVTSHNTLQQKDKAFITRTMNDHIKRFRLAA